MEEARNLRTNDFVMDRTEKTKIASKWMLESENCNINMVSETECYATWLSQNLLADIEWVTLFLLLNEKATIPFFFTT